MCKWPIDDYLYDYFNENNEQIYANISICFNIKNIEYLLKALNKSQFFENKNKVIQRFKKSLNKLSSKEVMDDIKQLDLNLLKCTIEKLK